MTKFENLTLENQAFQIEDCLFVNCILKNCRLFYRGGGFQWENTSFQNCNWSFAESAKATIELLMQIGLLKQGQTPPQSVTGTSTIH